MDSHSSPHSPYIPLEKSENEMAARNYPPREVAKKRILVVDDHPLLRHAVVDLVNRQPDMTVCGEADCISKADSLMRSSEPDLVLLDLRMGNGDTMHLIKTIRASHPEIRVLVLSQHDELLLAERCLRAGADGYITKLEAISEVINAIRCVLRGETYLSRTMAIALLGKASYVKRSRPQNGIEALTDRELHVFQLIGAGLGTTKIALELGVSPKTIEAHKEHIKTKIGAANAQELLRAATAWITTSELPA